ncbi:bromodomain adjacent to zinc finger domain protein 2B isoform X3 [Anabrus simplex]|uniref:bromodomain adjacent to zinc finger domain protein 2B isoform X3 n=1 Tax=Anabrus simplex TaxID=316456 RepID=UPI0035A30B21
MDKESGETERGEKDAASLLDAASLFAYWPRGDSSSGPGSTASHSLFGGMPGGFGNHMSSHHLPGTFAMMGGRGASGGGYGPPHHPPTTAPTGSFGSLGTLSVAASQAASLGINPAASAAWWTMASHLAAQDYLARLQASAAASGMSFGGLPGAESLVPGYPMMPHSQPHVSSNKSSSSNKMSSSSKAPVVTTTSVMPTTPLSASMPTPSGTGHHRDRDREREREQRDRERERDREQRERERERAATPVVSNAPPAHATQSIISDPASILGGVRLPPDTEIIKYTSSIVGPKVPGTTNRGRKKTISLDPPSVSVVPAHSSTGLLIERGGGTPRRHPRQRTMDTPEYRDGSASSSSSLLDRERDRDRDRVEVIKLPAHSSNGAIPLNIPSFGSSSTPGNTSALNLATSTPESDAPLNLSLKPPSSAGSAGNTSSNASSMQQSSLSSLSSLSASLGVSSTPISDRIFLAQTLGKCLVAARRKPGPKPRRVIQSSTPTSIPASPSPSLAQLFAAADSPRPSSGSEENDSHSKVRLDEDSRSQDGRPRNLGRGVSKPKKNTVASLLAQSRALGIKPSPSLEVAINHQQVSLGKSNMGSLLAGCAERDDNEADQDADPDLDHEGDHEFKESGDVAMGSSEDCDGAHSPLATTISNPAIAPSIVPGSGISEDSKSDSNKHKRHLVSSRSDDNNKVKIRAVEGLSEDSSAPDVSSDSGSASEGFPSDSEEDGEGSEAGKQEGDESTGPAAKRRKIEVDERELRIPLEHGWRRETLISGVSRNGIVRGEVTYFSPCGRRFKQYHDVVRFLEKNNITDMTRENFSFSSKVMIGDFLQPGDELVRLTEEQVMKRLEELRLAHGHSAKSRSTANKLGGGSRLAHEQKMHLQMEREKAAMAAKEAKRIAKEEAARQKEQVRLQKEQERCERQEAVRREREQRNLQMMEARRRRQEELEKQRHEEQLRKQQERELKRQQAVLLKEQERERRRQHMMLVKALESRKRLEERERKRQEMRAEKMASKERKMEQRRMELELVRELRKPVEDMELSDQRPLPTLNRIPGLKLSGQAFADTLMVFEFLHNFGETLGFDMDSLPSLNSLQMALLNDEEAEEELLSVMTHLLVCAIEDPGIPNPARHTTILGQSLKQADITHANISEILRIYLYANATGEVKALTGIHFERDREKKSDHHNTFGEPICPGKNAAFFEHLHENHTWRMSEWLQERPFLALNPTHKASILAFLCNELLQNKAVIRQIDTSIETVGQLRKDRWLLDTKIRKLRMMHGRKVRQTAVPTLPKAEDESSDSKVKPEGDDADEGDDEDADEGESGNESEGTQPEEDEDKDMSAEELTRKIEKLTRQSEQSLQALSTSAQQLRATCFGQDRFWRRYWSLPCAGGIFVEAMESAEPKLENEHRKARLAREEENERLGKDVNGANETVKQEVGEEVTTKNSSEEGVKCVKVENNVEVSESNQVVKVKCDAEERTTVEDTKSCSRLNELLAAPVINEVKKEEREVASDLSAIKMELKSDLFVSELNALKEEKPLAMEDMEKLLRPIQFERLGECMEKAGAASEAGPVIIPNGDKFNALNQLYSLNSSSMFSNGKDLNGSFLLGATAGGTVGERNWFSVLPREACDSASVTNGLNTTRCIEGGGAELRIPVFPPPSPGGSQCESPAPLVLTLEEMMQLEQLKRCGIPEPGEAKPVPEELCRGWWRVTDQDQLQTILDCLHSRGVRERELKRVMTKFMDHALESCGKVNVAGGDRSATDLAITDADHKVAALPGGAPLADEPRDWLIAVALRVDVAMLEQVETLEEKVANASMQVKGWKVPGRVTTEEGVTFRPSCVPADGDTRQNPIEIAKTRLLSLEAAIERRYLRPPLGVSTGDVTLPGMAGETPPSSASCPTEDIPKGLVVWREAVGRARTSAQLAMALYMLEASIAWDKSIMKANCQFCHSGDNEDKLLLCDGCDKGYHTYCFRPKMENIPDGDWYCYECMNKATGERNCIVCGKKGGSKNVVVCDTCPRAYHTDCHQPVLSKVPRGKWYCHACQSKQPRKRGSGRRPKHSESSDHTPSSNTLKTEDSCVGSPQAATPTSVIGVDEVQTPGTPGASPSPHAAPATPGRKDRTPASGSNKKLGKDLNPCRALLEDLEAHDEAWPFLLPVNTKQFPTYRKIIRSPMDLSTIKRKLQDSVYKSRDEFCADVRLIFNNCETFNEDDSPVGKAGHSMRSFFETRWGELNGHNSKSSPSSTS